MIANTTGTILLWSRISWGYCILVLTSIRSWHQGIGARRPWQGWSGASRMSLINYRASKESGEQ